MSDRIEKALRRMTTKERAQIHALIEAIIAGRYSEMDLKKLKGHSEAYRVRKGDFRIIFTLSTTNNPHIIAIERRSDKTYNEL